MSISSALKLEIGAAYDEASSNATFVGLDGAGKTVFSLPKGGAGLPSGTFDGVNRREKKRIKSSMKTFIGGVDRDDLLNKAGNLEEGGTLKVYDRGGRDMSSTVKKEFEIG